MKLLHALVIYVGVAAFFLAVVTGVAFLVQERRLKLKDPTVLRSGAIPLEMLDRVNLWAVIVGFALFSVGMLQGVFLAQRFWKGFWEGDASVVGSIVTWAAYAVVLWLRITAGLRGRRVVFMSVMSFLLVIFTVVGVNYCVVSRHLF